MATMLDWLRRKSPSPADPPVPALDRPLVDPRNIEPTTLPALVADIPADKIASRAYENWVLGGRRPGTEVEDWLRAEAELRAEYAVADPPAGPANRKPR